jgi:small subunit ribosomal protein S6
MSESQAKLYEGLFLLRQEAASSDFNGCVEFLKNVFERAGADVKVLRKWEERRLAYDIKGQRRGIFMLAFFSVAGVQIANIERDCELSDQVLRCLIVRADHVGETELELEAKEADMAVESALRERTDADDEAQADDVDGQADESDQTPDDEQAARTASE